MSAGRKTAKRPKSPAGAASRKPAKGKGSAQAPAAPVSAAKQAAQAPAAPAGRSGPQTIDEYLAKVQPVQRSALEVLRQTIRRVAPEAQECISYQIPAFRWHGMLVGFGASVQHCALYLMSAATVAAHRDELRGYDTSTGTIRFAADKPLPESLVRKLVQARMAENASRR